MFALCVSCAGQEGGRTPTPRGDDAAAPGVERDAAPGTTPEADAGPAGTVKDDTAPVITGPDAGTSNGADANVTAPGRDGGPSSVVGGTFPLPPLGTPPTLPAGTAPSGNYNAEEVPGSPSFDVTGMVWWGDRLIIADRGKRKLFQLVPPSTFSELPNLDLRDPTGIALDGEGNLLIADCGVCFKTTQPPSRIVRVSRAGKRDVALELMNPTQDIVAHSGGMMYWGGFDDGPVRAAMPGGTVSALSPSVGHSYGTAISPMQDWLYASSKIPDRRKLYRFALDAAGKPETGEVVMQFEKGTAVGDSLGRLQGITADALGNVYLVGSESQVNPAVVIVSPGEKKVVGMVYKIPSNRTDVAFGDADLRTLYIGGGGKLYRAKLPVTGTPQ